jgi:trimeric autotransporter adhesin
MRSYSLPARVSVALALVLFMPQVLLAQYAISAVAGGGPDNLTALSSSIGYPGSIARDAAGNTYIADRYSSHIFKVDTTGTLTVVAGNGTLGYFGDGGLATSAALNGPEGVFVDAAGNIFIADTDNSVIREVTASNGNITTVAGNGKPGYAGDGGPATSAQLYDPFGVFVDGAGDLFIADTDNAVIREVVAGTIQTVAGNGTICPDPTTPCGDGGAATSAQLDLPEGLFIDALGNIFIADTDSNRIRVVNTGTAPITVATVVIQPGNIQTVAGAYYQSYGGTACVYSGDGGPATGANLCVTSGVFVDGSENIFIADTNNLRIREVAVNGTIQTVAGDGTAGYSGDGGAATSAELNYPSGIFVDGSGDIWIADTDNFVIREVTAGNIQTLIGNNTLAYSGDGGSALNAELNYPGGLSVDGSGDFFIADSASSVIREVLATSGDIQTVAGNGTECPDPTTACGDGGAATSAQLNNPYGLFLDASGNIFIADTADNRIRAVNTGSTPITIAGVVIQPGNIATVAGNGTAGYLGDNGPATSAELSSPNGVFVDSAENIFIADTGNSVIREVAASSGTITTVAGNATVCTPATAACGDGGTATSAQLNSPAGVFVDVAENIFIADTFDNRIRAVNTGTQAVTIAGVVIQPGDIATVAGTGGRGYAGDGAAATSALLDTPYGVFVDIFGDIFIADTENFVIREVVAATGYIQTVAGNNTAGFSGDGGQSTSAELNSPLGLVGDSAGDLFVADTDNSRIRELVPTIFVTVTPNPVNVAINAQQQFTATVTGTSNTSVTWQVDGVVGGNSTVGTISTTGLFQAPATIPTPATVTVTAIANADGTTSGSAQATIVTAGGAVKVTVSSNPPIADVYTGTTQAFNANVTGTTNTAVTWQVNGVTGGNTTFGTISSSGLYSAPTAVPSPATVTVKAISQANSTAFGTASVMIVTVPSAAQPPPQTTSPGGTAKYSLLLNENTGDPRYAIKLACLQSSLPAGATCSFLPSTITPASLAVPFTLTIAVPSSSAFLEKPNGMRLQLYFAFVPLAGILFAGAGRRNKQRRWLWLAGLCVFLILLNACGGGGSNPAPTNPELGTYNVQVQGTTSAQPNPATITTVGLTVQ